MTRDTATITMILIMAGYLTPLWAAPAMLESESESVPNTVLLYNGSGVSPQCLDETRRCLQQYLTPTSDIQLVDADYLTQSNWLSSTRLFVMPGGQDLPYVAELQPQVTHLIRRYVSNGGVYLGLCAGAYFASKRVEFEMDRPDYRVCGDRDLALIDAVAKGAAFPGFISGKEDGARAAHVKLINRDDCVPFYFNGGPYFHIENHLNVEVIGEYADGRPAIVTSRFGQGLAVLSGVHMEFDPDTMISTREIVDELQEWNRARIQFLSDLKRLMNV